MEEITCPNCNVDVEREELRRNNLRCPTCGYNLSESTDAEEPFDDEWEDEEDDTEEEDEEET